MDTTRARPSKLTTAANAVQRLVNDGDTLFLGYTTWPAALEREIVRQHKRHLTAVGAVAPVHLPLAGCVDRIITAFLQIGRSETYKRLLAESRLSIEDVTNQTVTLMLMAGALGIPFIPTRSLLGSDFASDAFFPQPHGFLGEKKLHLMRSPFEGEQVALLPALRPDVACVHVQWADEEGNAVFWGGYGEVKWGLWASKRVIISAEEIVPPSVLRSDPQRVTIPGALVDAVVHMPFGALPWGVPGYYCNDGPAQYDYITTTRTDDGLRTVLDEWIYGCPDHNSYLSRYLDRYGKDALERLRVNVTWEPERPIRYGWRSRQ